MVTALLVTDITVYQEALREVLSQGGEVRVVAAATNGPQASGAAQKHRPDVALIHLPLHVGLSTASSIRAVHPRVRIVAYCVSEAEEVIAWRRAGALACVHREDSLSALREAATRAAYGEFSCSGRLANVLFGGFSPLIFAAPEPDAADLTYREREILQMLNDGLSNKQIASALHISVPTVKTHLRNAYAKLHVHRRADAAAAAIHRQLR